MPVGINASQVLSLHPGSSFALVGLNGHSATSCCSQLTQRTNGVPLLHILGQRKGKQTLTNYNWI